MDFSSTAGGFGEALAGAGSSFLSSITGQIGSALGQKLNNSLGIAPKQPAPQPPPTPSPIPSAATPQAAVQPQNASGMSTLSIVAIAVGGSAAAALVIFAIVKLAK